MIAVIDYGLGNLQSIMNALTALNEPAELVIDAQKIGLADGIIIPGVGAFRDGMSNLSSMKIIPALSRAVLENKKPLLGVCLGMQLIAKKSFEHGEYDGLGWVDFTVRKIAPSGPEFRVPHMGWNDLNIVKPESPLYQNIHIPATVYFVHSYHLEPNTQIAGQQITATSDHGQVLTASIESDNIFGVQFHPEKSQNTGLAILKNFINIVHNRHA